MDILGTLGPACSGEDILERMFRQGMTGMRLNLSHTTLGDSRPLLERMFRAARTCGIQPKLIIDMQGPELRVGKSGLPLKLIEGERIPLASILLPKTVLQSSLPGTVLKLDDGELALRVMEDGASAIVVRGGTLLPGKSVAAEGMTTRLPALTAADRQNIAVAAEYGVTGVMQPFVRGREDLEEVRKALDQNDCKAVSIYAKIENMEGLSSLKNWMDLADVLVIARGDLGNAVPLWTLPAWQKRIAALALEKGKPFLIATQMLASMEHSPVPTRAEVSDVFNAVLDGASAVLLTGETAGGAYPVQAMEIFCKTAQEALTFRKGDSPEPFGR